MAVANALWGLLAYVKRPPLWHLRWVPDVRWRRYNICSGTLQARSQIEKEAGEAKFDTRRIAERARAAFLGIKRS